ncbi:MAG: HlyD family secretion protein [Candidatus Omnitrophota bacterium]
MSDEKDQEINRRLQSLDIRSDEVQEIMGYIPHWIIRWGITVIFIVVMVVMIGSWFFKYPDIINSTIVLTTKNPPATLMARTTGKIEALFVHDKQQVNEGEHLVVIENATDYRNLFQLKTILDSFKRYVTHSEFVPNINFNRDYSLGELQSSYASFLGAYDDFQHFTQLDIQHKKINSINIQIERHKIMYEQLKRQIQIMEEDVKLSRQNYERSEALFKDGIISKNDADTSKSVYLQKQYAFENAKSSLDNSTLQIAQLEQTVMELGLNYTEEKKRLQLALSQAYENLTGHIDQWEQVYLLKSPYSGEVSFTKYWSVNQNVTTGDKVLTVIPTKGGEIIGKVILPVQGSGKVKIGQKVNIKLFNYPYMDYGMVGGIVTTKSLVAADNFYLLEVRLTHGLVTSYNKTLEFAQEMQGSAEIITEDVRLIDRIFKPIKNILKKPE